jgi:hypothetical protein
MRVKASAVLAFILFVAVSARNSSAESRWINTSGGTLDWTTSGNWSGAFPPGFGDDVRITNDLTIATTIINAGRSNTLINTATINFLAISNGSSSTPITVIQSPNLNWVSRFGVQLGKNATLILTTNAQFGVDQNMAFDLRAGGQPGTLILSNAAATSGFSSFLVRGSGSTTNAVSNNGTIMFKPNNGQQVSMNYGQTLMFTNGALGTVVMNGVGTGTFVGNFGSQNRAFINSGTILVNAGTLRIDPRDAFSRGGFMNTATGYVQVDSGGVLEIRRTTNAWINGPTVTNFGRVFMNGGSVVALELNQSGAAIGTNANRVIANAGTIAGNGTFYSSINTLSGGIVSPGLSLGALNVAGNATFGSNSTLTIELSLVDGQSDLLAVGGNVTLDSSSALNISGGVVGNVYTVMTFSAVSGSFGTVTPNYTLSYNLNNLTIEVVPEPSTILLIGAGLPVLMMLRRRKHSTDDSRNQ